MEKFTINKKYKIVNFQGDFNFCKIFSGKDVAQTPWEEDIDEDVLIKMFECLRFTGAGRPVTSQVKNLLLFLAAEIGTTTNRFTNI